MLGCDFEGFVRINNRYVPAERVLKGGKNSPVTLAKGVVGHPDNVMAEAALAAPVEAKDFSKAVTNALECLKDYINPAAFIAESSHKFTSDWLDHSVHSKEVGCEPDFDTVGKIYRYGHKDLGLYRFAGFHIHFDTSVTIPPAYAAQVVDCTIGLASIAFEWDINQGRRRQFYGTAGRHRVKPYGIEYRTLSSNMLRHIQDAQPLIEKVADALENEVVEIMMLPQLMWDAAKEAIETEDVAMAKALWMEAGIDV